MKKLLIVAVIYLSLGFLAFGNLPHTFFQQDEWAIMGTYFYWDKTNLNWIERLFTYGQGNHTIPLSGLLSYFQYKIFGLNYSSYAYFSIGIHLLNSFLVFYLAYLLFKKKFPAFIAGLIFLIDFISSQSVTWIATTNATAGSTLFTLLSLIFLTKYSIYKYKKVFLALTFMFLFMSLLFKESSIFMFLFIPLFIFTLDSKKAKGRLFTYLIPAFIVGVMYLLPRITLKLLNSPLQISLNEGVTYPTLSQYIYRIFTFPLKIVSQIIIPQNQIVAVAEKAVNYGYPNLEQIGIPNMLVAQTIGADLASYFLTIIILLIALGFYLKTKKNGMYINANIILISLLFIALSALPMIFVPGKPGYFSLFDGRYLYLGSIFKSILLANVIYLTLKFCRNKKTAIILIIAIMLYVGFNLLKIRNNMENDVLRGEDRISILNQIEQKYPRLPNNVVFYTESYKAFYGLPLEEKIMPFFSGFGQTLLVWYSGHGENFPSCFFKDNYLYTITDEGYKDCEGRSYGYFRKFDSLKNAVVQYKFNPKNIISFKFTNDNEIIDISKEVMEKLTSK